MNERTKGILARVHDLPGFDGVDSSDVNGCGTDGDNALHVVVRWGDIADAQELIDAGIEVNKAGDLGYTPLHLACMSGNREMVELLLESGADLFALSEGYPPFTTARLAGKDDICDLLAPFDERSPAPRSKDKSEVKDLSAATRTGRTRS